MRSQKLMEANHRPASGPVMTKPADEHFFYNECSQHGITREEAHLAKLDAVGWHERWIHDRLAGAKNPSPPEKRHPLKYSRSSGMTPSPTPTEQRRQQLQLLQEENDYESCSDDDDFGAPPRNIAAPLLRPIAVRIAPRPTTRGGDPTCIDLRAGRQEPSPLELPPTLADNEDDDMSSLQLPDTRYTEEEPSRRIIRAPAAPRLEDAKAAVLHALASTGGDDKSALLDAALKPLLMHYADTHVDARLWGLEGMWLTLTKPTYAGNLGLNHGGDPMYTLGRMSFDMFRPCQLVCSLQGTFNTIEPVLALEECVAPKSLKEEVQQDGSVLRTYDIVTAFTIEPYHPDFGHDEVHPNHDVHRPIRGIMTTHGYALPDPQVPNRLSIWFTGGVLQPNNDATDQEEWKKLFCNHPLPSRTFSEKAMVLAAKLLMGATLGEMREDGTMTFEFTRPIGGHGMAYVDVLYLDSGLRIVRGHKGTLYVFVKVPDHVHEE